MMSKITFIASGDAFITRRLPAGGYEGFEELRRLISAHDAAFSNLEMTFHDHEAPAGADVVLGHGPHVMRGIDIYKGKPIFMSLGNFLFETETVEVQPYDQFYNKDLPVDTGVGAFMDKRSHCGTTGYPAQQEIWRSFLAGFTIEEDRVTEVQLYPISLGWHEPRSRCGVPVLSHDEATLMHLVDLSRPFGTEIRIKDGVGYINL